MNPAHHPALSDADLPDTLMQLLLPSDEWYYTNHSTKFARYVKYHAARILVYMGLFHRLGGRVDLFDSKPFEETSMNPLLQVHHPEDTFIDQMALGRLLIRGPDGRVRAGSLEGLIAELIKLSELQTVADITGYSNGPGLLMTSSHGPLPPSLICDRNQATASPERSRSASLNESALQNLGEARTRATNRFHKRHAVGLSEGLDYEANTTNFPEDLSQRPFQEFFFHAVPLVIHPVIILRILCHRMFGNMLRRKSRYSAQNLSPPLVVESDTCPPRSLSSETDLDKKGEYDDERTGNLTTGRSTKRKGNLHVQITTPTPTTPPAEMPEDLEEMIRQMRRRTKRAGSMDKHLMRMGLSRKRGNRTMSLAIKAIGESLVTPLDLNISPPAQSDHDVSGSGNSRTMSVKKNIFRFPSVKAKTKQISKSHDYLAALGQSLEDESLSPKSSAASLNCEEKDIRDFQRELINLPTFEVDTHRMDQCTSPLLSRSNSVPEHLGTLLIPAGLDKSPSVCQISVTEASEETRHPVTAATPMVLSLPRNSGGDNPSHNHSSGLYCNDKHSRSNLALTIGDNDSDFQPGDIVVKFAAATPMESPASNIDEPLSPLLSKPSPSGSSIFEQHLSELSLTHNEQLQSPGMAPNHLTVTNNSTASSIFLSGCAVMSASPSTASFQSEFTCRSLNHFSTNPSIEIPTHHAGVMAAVEMWVDVCPLDLESTPLMKREMKDFLHKMAGLGLEYKAWSIQISDKLNLEEPDAKRNSASLLTDADNVNAQYKKLQTLVVAGELPCSREEAATLAGIQLHLDETWPEEEAESGHTDDDLELEKDTLLKNDDTDQKKGRREFSIHNRTRKFASSRRRGKLTKHLVCLGDDDGDGGTTLCMRRHDGRYANCLPPELRSSSKVRDMINEKQIKLWHTPCYDNELKLKQLYIKICKNLPCYGCKIYRVKEILRGNTSKKVTRLLGISSEKVVLLNEKTKLRVQDHAIRELQEWRTGTGKAHDGLIIEFRASKPWTLLAPSIENLKSVTAALWEAMDTEGRYLENAAPQRDLMLDFDFGRRLQNLVPEIDPIQLYTEELESLQKLLPFPEEVAMRLTEVEHALFNSVPPMYYIRHITLDLSRTSTATRHPNVQDLIQRFNEVSSWVTHIIITQATHEDRKAVLSCILRLAATCWNIGNFNAAVEILSGLKSEKLKPFWLSLSDEDLTILHTLSSALLSWEPTFAYRSAITKALDLPRCKVVPFFGGFLRDLRMILAGVPSVIVVPSGEHQQLEFVSEFNGEDRFMTRIGVGGLINLEKISQAHVVLNDIHLFQQDSTIKQKEEDQELEESDFEDYEDPISPQIDSDYELDQESYGPIQPVIPNSKNALPIITTKLSRVHLNDLQCLHHGSTVVRWESNNSHSSICFLRLEADNATLSWCKPQWSALRGNTTTALPDYVFTDKFEIPGLANKYGGALTILDDFEEGHIDLSLIKGVLLGESSSADLGTISKRHGLDDLTKNNCLSFLFGSNIADNRLLEFVLPSAVSKVWFRGLRRLVRASMCLRRRHTDRRMTWLKEQYMTLVYESEKQQGPLLAEAIKAFGGRKWNAHGSVSPSTNVNPQMAFKRQNSVMGGRNNRKRLASHTPAHKDVTAGGAASHPYQYYDHRTKDKDSTPKGSNKPKGGTVKGDPTQTPNNTKGEKSLNKSKFAPVTVFKPKNLTFNFIKSGYRPRNRRRLSLGGRSTDPNKSITHSQSLEFLDFVDLFRAFSLRCRKDLKDLFEQVATSKPSIERKLNKTELFQDPPRKDMGLITRNTVLNSHDEGGGQNVCDVFAVSSIVANSTDLDKSKGRCLGLQELREFLEDNQECRVTDQDLIDIIQQHEPDQDMSSLCKLSFEGFARYLMDKDNYAFINEHVCQDQADMEHPLSHYYIESSHNTYLTGHQLKGESSVELYAQVLLTGCRCVELDCWDGDDGSPIIYHGHTLTTKIPFRGVIEAVNRCAFVTSPYPVILSIENHCSIQQQQKMAEIFIEVLGDKLVMDFLFESDFIDDPMLPSPNQLRHKILIKNKKLRTPQTPNIPVKQRLSGHIRNYSFSLEATNFDEDDDEDDDDEDDVPIVKELMRQSTSSQEGGVLPQGLHSQQSLPFGSRQPSADSGQPQCVIDRVDQIDRQIQCGSNESLSDKQNNDRMVASIETSTTTTKNSNGVVSKNNNSTQSKPKLEEMTIIGNGGSTIPRSDSLTEMLPLTETLPLTVTLTARSRVSRQKSGSCDNLDDSHSKLSSQTSSEGGRPRSGSFAGSLEGGKETEDGSAGSSWPGCHRKQGSREADKEFSGGQLLHTSRTRSRDSHDSHSDATTLSRRESIEDMIPIPSKQRSNSVMVRPRSEPGVEWQFADGKLDLDQPLKPPKKKKVAIAQELSDLVIYTQAVKFRGLVVSPVTSVKHVKKVSSRKSILPAPLGASPGGSPSTTSSTFHDKSELVVPVAPTLKVKSEAEAPSCYHMSSLNENKAKTVCRRQPIGVINNTEKHLMRMYPAGMRIDSSNFNPVAYWMCGIQLVALNYQTEDTAMHINTAMFEQSGRSGYVLKPTIMWDKSHVMYGRFNPWDKEFDGLQPSALTIQLISGQYTCPNNHSGSVQVEVEIIGIPADCAKHKSKVISRNSLNPIWNEVYSFQIHFVDLAFVRFTVTDITSSHITAQRVVPLKSLRPGYRHLRLRSPTNHHLGVSSLFVYSRLEEEISTDYITMALDHRDEEIRPRQRGLLSRIKDVGELAKYDKERKKDEKRTKVSMKTIKRELKKTMLKHNSAPKHVILFGRRNPANDDCGYASDDAILDGHRMNPGFNKTSLFESAIQPERGYASDDSMLNEAHPKRGSRNVVEICGASDAISCKLKGEVWQNHQSQVIDSSTDIKSTYKVVERRNKMSALNQQQQMDFASPSKHYKSKSLSHIGNQDDGQDTWIGRIYHASSDGRKGARAEAVEDDIFSDMIFGSSKSRCRKVAALHRKISSCSALPISPTEDPEVQMPPLPTKKLMNSRSSIQTSCVYEGDFDTVFEDESISDEVEVYGGFIRKSESLEKIFVPSRETKSDIQEDTPEICPYRAAARKLLDSSNPQNISKIRPHLHQYCSQILAIPRKPVYNYEICNCIRGKLQRPGKVAGNGMNQSCAIFEVPKMVQINCCSFKTEAYLKMQTDTSEAVCMQKPDSAVILDRAGDTIQAVHLLPLNNIPETCHDPTNSETSFHNSSHTGIETVTDNKCHSQANMIDYLIADSLPSVKYDQLVQVDKDDKSNVASSFPADFHVVGVETNDFTAEHEVCSELERSYKEMVEIVLQCGDVLRGGETNVLITGQDMGKNTTSTFTCSGNDLKQNPQVITGDKDSSESLGNIMHRELFISDRVSVCNATDGVSLRDIADITLAGANTNRVTNRGKLLEVSGILDLELPVPVAADNRPNLMPVHIQAKQDAIQEVCRKVNFGSLLSIFEAKSSESSVKTMCRPLRPAKSTPVLFQPQLRSGSQLKKSNPLFDCTNHSGTCTSQKHSSRELAPKTFHGVHHSSCRLELMRKDDIAFRSGGMRMTIKDSQMSNTRLRWSAKDTHDNPYPLRVVRSLEILGSSQI